MIDNAGLGVPRCDFPPGSCFWSARVPGVTYRMPELIRMDSGPSEPLDFLTRYWKTPRATRIIEVHRLSNVYVVDPGLVFDADRRLYEPTASMFSEVELSVLAHQLDVALDAGEVRRRPGVSLLCGKAGMFNYGHWLIEMLPFAFLMRDQLLAEGWSVFLPHVYPWMTPVIRDSLGLLGVPDDARFENDGSPIWFEELVVVTGVSQMGFFYLPVTVEALLEIGRLIEPEGSDRLWMTRLGRKRALLREEELCEQLCARGWAVMDPGEATLKDQIAASKAARHMAGVCGAGLTNLGFMPSTGKITSFSPSNMGDVFFWSIAANRNLAFCEVRCPIKPLTDGAIPWDVPLHVEPEKALALLD